MCRGKNICSELGIDSTKWNNYSPLPKPQWMNDEVDVFIKIAEAFSEQNKTTCLDQLFQIRSSEITEWYIEHGQMSGRHRKIQLEIPPPPTINISQRDPVRSPAKIQNEVFLRDAYHCRYCGGKLLSQEFIKMFIKKIDSPLYKRGETNLTTHGIIHITWPVADHVIPWNKGGKTSLENLVTSCAPCNYGKDGYTIEQLGLENPFRRKPVKSDWNGLRD
jgi:5-methylcytosine-specific restriction endonuclease McrA